MSRNKDEILASRFMTTTDGQSIHFKEIIIIFRYTIVKKKIKYDA